MKYENLTTTKLLKFKNKKFLTNEKEPIKKDSSYGENLKYQCSLTTIRIAQKITS